MDTTKAMKMISWLLLSWSQFSVGMFVYEFTFENEVHIVLRKIVLKTECVVSQWKWKHIQ